MRMDSPAAFYAEYPEITTLIRSKPATGFTFHCLRLDRSQREARFPRNPSAHPCIPSSNHRATQIRPAEVPSSRRIVGDTK